MDFRTPNSIELSSWKMALCLENNNPHSTHGGCISVQRKHKSRFLCELHLISSFGALVFTKPGCQATMAALLNIDINRFRLHWKYEEIYWLSFSLEIWGKAIFSTQYLKWIYVLSLVTLHSLRWSGVPHWRECIFAYCLFFCFLFLRLLTEYFFHWSMTALQCYVGFCCARNVNQL